MGGGKGGSGGGDTQTIQSADPWAGITPFLLGAEGTTGGLPGTFPEARRLYMNEVPELYPAQMFINRTPLETQARDLQLGYLTGPEMAQDINQVQSAVNFGLGDVLYPESNPAMQAYMDAANRGTVRQLTENILPSYRGGFIDAGQIGSSREAMAEGMAMEEAVRSIADTNAKIAMGGYGQGLEHMAKSVAFAPMSIGMDLQIPEAIKAIGAEDRSWMEKPLQEDITRWNYYEGLPQQKLNEYLAALSGYPTGAFGTTTSTTDEGGGSSKGMGMMGGALSGAAMGGALAGAAKGTAVMPVWGTAIGAILGALSGGSS